MAVSTIQKPLILSLSNTNVQTNANGFIRLDYLGINVQNSFPLQVYALSPSYPNGLTAVLLMAAGTYWVRITDENGTSVKNTPVSIYLRYTTV